MGDTMPESDRRRYRRYDLQQQISYVLNRSHSEQMHTGIMVNMSSAGMCLNVSNPVSSGQEITIKRENQFYIEGTVVWCDKLGETLNPYKVGLKFEFEQ